jgi:hypothetical protein
LRSNYRGDGDEKFQLVFAETLEELDLVFGQTWILHEKEAWTRSDEEGSPSYSVLAMSALDPQQIVKCKFTAEMRHGVHNSHKIGEKGKITTP